MREGWEIKKLGDACILTMGQSPDSSTYNEAGNGMPFFQGCADFGVIHPTITTFCSAPKKIAEVDDVLMSVRAPIGTLNVANAQCCIGRGLASIRQKPGITIYKYLYYFISKSKKRLQDLGTGATFKAIGKETLVSFPIPVPPVQEQEKIVAELDCLTSIIEKKRQQLKELDNLAQSIFYDMFGDPITNEKGWEQLPFEQSIQKVKYTRKLQTKDFLEEGQYPIISQEEDYISGYWNDVEDVFHIPAPVVIFGDHTRVLKYVDFDFVLGADGVRVLLPIKAILPRFLFSYLKASKIPSLGYSRHYKLLKEMMVSVPPFDLQIRFTEKVEAIEKQKELIKKSIQETETLFNSRMDYWFN